MTKRMIIFSFLLCMITIAFALPVNYVGVSQAESCVTVIDNDVGSLHIINNTNLLIDSSFTFHICPVNCACLRGDLCPQQNRDRKDITINSQICVLEVTYASNLPGNSYHDQFTSTLKSHSSYAIVPEVTGRAEYSYSQA